MITSAGDDRTAPAVADPGVLRSPADQAVTVLDASPLTDYARTNWRQGKGRVVPVYNQERARWAAVTREDLAKFDLQPRVGVNQSDKSQNS